MAVNYYKKDKKTGKWVIDEKMASSGAKKSAQKATSNSAENEATAWAEYVANRTANIAAQDAQNAFNAAKKVDDFTNKTTYQIGGKQNLLSDRGLYGYEILKQQIPQYLRGLQSGNPTGMSTEENRALMGELSNVAENARKRASMLSARTGGLSSIDTSGMKKAEVNALGQMDNLSRRDDVYEKLQKYADQEAFEHNRGEIFGGMSEKEYLDMYTAYLRDQRNQKAQQAKMDKWQAGADAAVAEAQKMPGYEELSKYVPDEEYLYPDMGLLEGNGFYTTQSGEDISADEYRKNAADAFLAAFVDAGNDPEKRKQIEFSLEMIPELNNYNIEAIPYMTEDQKGAFFAIWNNGDRDDAKQMLKTLDYGLQAERVQTEQAQTAQDLENANWAEKALYSIGTVPQNLLNEAVGATQALAGIFNPKGLEDLHEYSAVYDAGREAQMVRGEIGQDIADATDYLTIPGTDINIPRMVYNAIMSSADSAANAFLFGGAGSWAPTLAMGSGAFANEYMNSQDYWDALVSMGIEAGTEYLPFDIMGNKAMKPGTKILSGMLAEGLGESTAEALNIGYDVFKNVENSEAQQNIDMLISQGYTPEDALRKTVKKYGLEVLESGLTGALSGAGSNAPSAIQANIENRNWGKNLVNNEGADALMDLADTLPVNDQAKDIIRRMRAENAEKGKGAKAEAAATDTAAVTAEDVEASAKASEKTARDRKEMSGRKKGEKAVKNAEVGYVYREVMRTVDAEAQNVVANTLAGDVALQLSESGFTGDVKKAARDIVNFISGKTDRQTMRTIEGSSEARRIALEYTAPVDRMMRAAERRSRIYELAGDVSQRARKDFVKPEATKAEKGAEEATKGIEDRAVITAADVEIADTPDSTVDGQAVTIEGVANVSDIGTVTYTVKDSEGNTREVSEDDVSIGQNDAVTAVLVENARELGRNADAMIRNYVQGQDVQAYAEAFKQALQYGEDGRNLDVVKGYSEMKALNEGQIETAYEIGRGRRTFRNTRMVRKNTAGIKVGNVDTSQINMHDLNAAQLMSVRSMSSLAKAVGFNLKFVESKADAEGRYTTENGSWDPETMTLTLDVHAGSNTANDKNYAMMHTAGHELTHYIKQFADGEMWNAYQEFVIGHLSTKDGKGFDLENAITAHIKTAREQGRYLDRDAAIEEVIANASGDALNKITEADLSALAQDNPGLFNKIKEFFSKWISILKKTISAAYKGAEAKTEEAQQMMDAVDEMGRRWNELLLNATKNRRESAKGENVASEATTTAEAEAPRSIGYRHIDQRTFDSVKEEDTELFASEVDEAQVGMAAAAKILLADLENSIPGQKVWLADNEVTGQKRQTSALIGRMKDELGLTWDKLRQNLMQFSNMDELVEGKVKLPRNSATNRRIELYLNEMLTEGYTALDGTRINPWDEYFNAISGIEGADSQKKYSTTRGAVDFVDYAWPGEVKYSRRGNDDETRSIKEQIKNHADVLNAMDPVANVASNPPDTEDLGALRQWAIRELERKGFAFDVANVGHIELSKSNIKRGLGYIGAKDRPTIAAIVALPEVLMKGSVIGKHYDHKGNKYSTVTIGAPVVVNDVRGNMGVVITQTDANHYKTHRIIMPDGSAFTFNTKAEAAPHTRVYTDVSDSAPAKKGAASGNSVSQQEPDVKKFSARSSVEYSKNLVAVHNITEEKLEKALKLGGFPMPSIAIAKDDIGHQNFGDISLVFGSDTIDPKANKRNKVYSADAWTPTFPRIEYEVDAKADDRVYNKLTSLKSGMDEFFVDNLKHVMYSMNDLLNRHGGEEGFVQYALHNYGLKAAYLEDTGRHADVIQRKEKQKAEFSEMQAEIYTAIEKQIGLDSIRHMPTSEIFEKHADAIEDIYPGSTKSRMRFVRILQNVVRYFDSKDDAPTYKTVTDTAATYRQIDDSIDPTDFEKWVRDLYKGIEGASGVYNGKDIFTSNGKRRSFASTHYPVSVEGIAKAMYDAHGGQLKNVSTFYDAKTLRAVTSKTFKSISDMHKAEGRLRARTQEEADALTNALNERLNATISKVLEGKANYANMSLYDQMSAMDNVGAILQEVAIKKYSVKTIKDGFAKYGYNISDSTAQEMYELLNEIGEMPVNIFEAKPERAVYFDEVKYAIIPDDMNADVRARLEQLVPDVRAYTRGNESQRLELLNAREDLKFQSRDLSNLSDRELLVRALDTELTPDERDHLERYKGKMDKLSEDQRRLEALNSEIVQLRQAGKTQKNSEELRKAMTNATTLRGRIDRTDAELNKIESAAMIKEIVRRNRAEASRSKATSLREWQEKEKYRKMLVTDAKKLHKWIVSPTSKGYTPEFMREPVAKFLETVDFTSKRALGGGDDTWNDQKFKDALEELRDAIGKLGNQQSDIDGGAQSFMGYIDLPANYVQNFNENISAIRKALDVGGRRTDTPVNRMTAAQMRELAQAFRVLNSSIVKVNTLVSNARYSSAKLAADETIDDMNELRARRKTNKAFEVLNTTFNWKNTTPYYAFQRMGRGAKAIFESLQDGWDKMAQNSATVIEFSRDTFTAKESRTWAKEISEVKLDNGETIQMTTAQKMSLYCLSKRPQATGHLLGGGIRVADIEGKRGSKISQAENYTLTLDDIGRITGSLTDRQKEVADALQRFMSDQCAKWGNEISMKRFGFNQMTELFYFPIETDSNNRARIDETKDGKNSMFRLLNMSSLKPLTPNANNAIVIHDIFDVFAGHASDMAKYNALALPILDFIKWYNHVERTEVRGDDGKTTGQITTRSTQKALERAFGQDAKSYLTAFIKDLNAEHDGGRNDGLINSIVGRAKSAAVGANLRVYGLQITSLPRAAYAINPVYLAKGLAKVKSLNPVNAIKGTEAQQKVGILKWKDLGFYSTDIGRSTRGMVKRDEGILGKIRDWSMAPAGWGDNWVSNIIYEAAKAEMKAKNPEIKPGSAEYDRRLNKRVREIVYKTQVVDSTMTRSDFMRSKGLASTLTAFMSEPTLTVNMLNESVQKAVETGRKGGNVRDILRASSGMAARAATTFAVTACITSLVESMFDALRDDDEYETFRQKFMDALWGTEDKGGNLVENFNIFAMLPYIKDVISIFQGYENSSLITQGWQQVQDFKTSIESWQNGKAPIYRVVYNGAKAASSMGGIAVGNAMRDFVSMYNTFLAPAWGTPKLQTYEDNETTAATAYYEAVKAGDTELAEYYRERMDVTGMDMAKVEKKLATLAGDDFVSGGMTEAEARKWLTSEGGYDSEKADTKMRDLNFKKETGVNYSDFKSAYVAGTISKSEATRFLKKYREYDDNQVYFTLQEWDGGEDWTKYGNFLDAVDAQGNYAAEGKKLLDHGVDKSDIARAISTAYKDAYREIHGTYEGNRLLEYLLDVYEAIGYDRDYERKYITKNWLKD